MATKPRRKGVEVNSDRRAATTVGVLLIIALGSTILSGTFTGSKDGADYLAAVSADENRVLIGALFQFALTASVVAIPVVMYPILKGHNLIHLSG